MNIRTADLLEMTAREMVVRHDAYVTDRWNHTARVSTYLQNIAVLVSAFGGNKNNKMASFSDEHPLMKSKPKGLKVTSRNFKQVLQPMFVGNGR